MPGYYAYIQAQRIQALGVPFDAIIQAAMRQADSTNLVVLRTAFPREYADLMARYHAPGGLLEGETA